MKKRRAHIALLLMLTALAGTLRCAAYPYFFQPLLSAFDHIAGQLAQADFDNERAAVSPRLLDQLDSLARSRADLPVLQARAIYWRVRIGQMSAQPAACIDRLEQALQLVGPDHGYDQAAICYQLAGNYERLGHYLKCYELSECALPVFLQCRDHYFLGNTYLLLAQLFYDIGDLDPARRHLEQARQSYAKAGFPLNRIYFFQALFMSAPPTGAEDAPTAQQDAEASALYRQSIAAGGNDWGMTVQAMDNLAAIFLRQNQPDSAEHYCREAYRLLAAQSPGNIFFQSMTDTQMAQTMLVQGRYDETRALLQQLLDRSDMLGGERMMADVYRLLWLVSDRQGRIDEAYRHLQTYNRLQAEQESEVRKREVPKAQAREAIARQQDHIKLLEQQSRLNRSLFIVALLVALVLLLIAVGIYMLFRHRSRLRDVENRELRNSLEQEAIIHQMNLKNFRDDIKQKDCEISSSTLLLANKNEVLQQLHDITKQFYDEGRIPREYVSQVNNVIGESLRNDDEWSRFKLHFDSVHPDFFVKLKQQSAELTENDLRLCAYLRIGMRAKQIAEMLNVTPDSINTARYRLRKKLGLSKGDKLDDYIRQV